MARITKTCSASGSRCPGTVVPASVLVALMVACSVLLSHRANAGAVTNAERIEGRIVNCIYDDLRLDRQKCKLTVRRNSFSPEFLANTTIDSVRVRRLLTSDPKGLYPVVAYLYHNHGSESHGQVTLYAQRFDSVLTLLQTATRGESAEDKRISLEFRDITKSIETPLKAVKDLADKQFRKNARAGAIVTLEMLEKIPDVEPGDNVVISYRNGALALHASGKALGRGVIGESIRVRNLASKRVITATITGSGVVSLRPPNLRGK